jgi:hypothetical protein
MAEVKFQPSAACNRRREPPTKEPKNRPVANLRSTVFACHRCGSKAALNGVILSCASSLTHVEKRRLKNQKQKGSNQQEAFVESVWRVVEVAEKAH